MWRRGRGDGDGGSRRSGIRLSRRGANGVGDGWSSRRRFCWRGSLRMRRSWDGCRSGRSSCGGRPCRRPGRRRSRRGCGCVRLSRRGCRRRREGRRRSGCGCGRVRPSGRGCRRRREGRRRSGCGCGRVRPSRRGCRRWRESRRRRRAGESEAHTPTRKGAGRVFRFYQQGGGVVSACYCISIRRPHQIYHHCAAGCTALVHERQRRRQPVKSHAPDDCAYNAGHPRCIELAIRQRQAYIETLGASHLERHLSHGGALPILEDKPPLKLNLLLLPKRHWHSLQPNIQVRRQAVRHTLPKHEYQCHQCQRH